MSDTLYEQAFEAAPTGIGIHDADTGTIVEANAAYADALGRDTADIEGRSLESLVDRSDRDTLRRAMATARDGEETEVRIDVPRSDGPDRVVALAFDLLTDGGDDIDDRLVSTVDTASEPAVDIRSERRLGVALAGTNTGVWEWDTETDEVYWSESMERLFGLEPGTFEGTFEAFSERVHPDDLSEVQRSIESAIENDDLFQADYRIRRDDGGERWVHARAELHDTEGGHDVMVGIVTDITDRMQTQEQLREQRRQYRNLVDRLPDAYYAVDDEWRMTFCNDAAAEHFETTAEQIEGERLWDIHPGANQDHIEQRFRRVMETREPESFEHQYGSGERWARLQIYPYADGVAVLSTDISDKSAELANVLNTTPIALYRFDSDGVFREARGTPLERLGIAPNDLIGESIWDLYADNDTVTDAAERALDGESLRYTLTLGDTTLETQYTPVSDDGEVTGAIGVSMDVTEIHRQRDRMEFFNSILRHDVLNGMTVIKMRGEVLADELDGDQRQYAQTIVDWCTNTTEVVDRVRRVVETLATPEEEYTLSPVDVSAILERKGWELRTAYPAAEFKIDVPDRLYVRADELLMDVLGNILTNSVEHNDPDGLSIAVTADKDGDTVRIRIADNGVGVEPDRRESVFRRGETSSKNSGSGFGLFFVDVMVEKYGGDVWIDDSDTGGARFVIELARAEGEDRSRESQDHPGPTVEEE